jgi:hypothetical protein
MVVVVARASNYRGVQKSVANHTIGLGTFSVPQLRGYNTNFVRQHYQLMDPVILTGFKPRRRRFYASLS